MDELKTWTVVQFVDDKTVEAVPSSWVQGDVCHWPSFAQQKLLNAIRKNEPLNTCWPTHQVICFRNATFDDYGKARTKAKLAEETSDLASDADALKTGGTCKRKRIQRYLSSSSNNSEPEDSILPTPPKIKKKLTFEVKNKPAASTPFASSFSLSPIMKSTGPEDMFSITKPVPRGKSSVSDNREMAKHFQPIQPNSVRPDGRNCNECKEKDKNFKILFEQNHLLRSLVTESLSEVRKVRELLESRGGAICFEAEKPRTNFLKTFPQITFPISTEEEFSNFETVLASQTEFDCGVMEFSRMGGSRPYNFVKRVLSSLITNEIALKYSFLGRKGKTPFKPTQMCKMITRAAEEGKMFQTILEVENAIATWLRRASDRRTSTQKQFQ